MKTQKTLIILLITGVLFSCSDGNNCKMGGGGLVTEFFSIEPFEKVNFQVKGNIILKQGASQSVIVKGHRNVVDALKQKVKNGTWDIDFNNECFRKYDLEIEIVLPKLTMASISGYGEIDIHDFSNQESLDLNISGKGTINLNTFNGITTLKNTISGDGVINSHKPLTVLHNNLNISGKGSYNGYPIIAENYHLNISGLGVCYIYANSKLDMNISGNGKIHYKGSPIITKKISGLGEIINEN